MSNKSQWRLRFLSMILLCFFCSCYPVTPSTSTITETEFPIGDGGLLSGVPCGAPCFWDIVPGTTSEADTLRALASHGVNLDDCRIYQRDNPTEHGVKCGSIRIAFNDLGIVTVIGLTPSQKITLGDVVSRYGDPDAVNVGIVSVTVEPQILGVLIYYDHMKTTLNLKDQEYSVFIEPGSTVEYIGYSEEQSYTESRNYTQPWHGYGEYTIIMP